MSEQVITIRRDGEEIGSWNKFEIRQYIESGAILPTDEFFYSESNEWKPLLPQYRRKYSFFDWAGDDDIQWYYYKNGYMYGPRTSDEIDALAGAGLIEETDMICFVGADAWSSYGELINDQEEASDDGDAEEDRRHLDAAREHIMTGNWLAVAANTGAHFFMKRQNPPK